MTGDAVPDKTFYVKSYVTGSRLVLALSTSRESIIYSHLWQLFCALLDLYTITFILLEKPTDAMILVLRVIKS